MSLLTRSAAVVAIPTGDNAPFSSTPRLALVPTTPGCEHCVVNCGRSPLTVPVTGADWVEGESVTISVSSHTLNAGLIHSLILPLAGFVVGAVVGDQVFANEAGAIGFALMGFGVGAFSCRKQSAPHINRIETNRS